MSDCYMDLDNDTSDRIDKIARNIANEWGLKYMEVKKVIDSQFDVVAKGIRNKDTIHLRYLGKFEYKPSIEKHMEITKNKYNNKKE